MGWLGSGAEGQCERVLFLYSPVWMLVVAAVVFFGFYEQFSANAYMCLGLSVALPCFVLPALFPAGEDKTTPYTATHGFKLNMWVAVVNYVGNHFVTHYFYNILGVRYTVPVGPWSVNGVPICMFLMTQPYFCTYHVLSKVLLRRLGLLSPAQTFAVKMSAVFAMAYVTAFMETWSISAFPHYTYPDQHLMFTVGSAFYALFFIATYPMYAHLDLGWPLLRVVQHALAASMLVLLLMDAWRLLLGPVMGSGTLPYAQA